MVGRATGRSPESVSVESGKSPAEPHRGIKYSWRLRRQEGLAGGRVPEFSGSFSSCWL